MSITPQAAANRRALAAAIWHVLAKTAGKEARRDDLVAGGRHGVKLAILGTVDGEPFREDVAATLSVGHDSTRAASATPDPAQLLGCVLAKLNTSTREAILRELPEDFAAAGNRLPAVTDELKAAVTGMLKRLRAKVSQHVRGAVSVKYVLNDDAEPPWDRTGSGDSNNGKGQRKELKESARGQPSAHPAMHTGDVAPQLVEV